MSADKTSVVSADKTSVVSADKTSVVSLCQQTSPKTSPSTFPTQGRPDVLSADTTDVLSADTTDVLSADTFPPTLEAPSPKKQVSPPKTHLFPQGDTFSPGEKPPEASAQQRPWVRDLSMPMGSRPIHARNGFRP